MYNRLRIFFVFFLSISLFAVEYSFDLNKREVSKGEPFYASFNIQGEDANIKLVKKDFSKNEIEVRYSGTQQHTSIVNFNISKKQIVQYEITIYKSGKITLPSIEIEINGQKIKSPQTTILVRDEDYNPQANRSNFFGNSLFDDFFTEPPLRRFKRPSSDELFVKFATTKEKVYVGEEIIGYYVLYHKNPQIPNFQRDVSSFIKFPFFKVDSLDSVKIQFPKQQIYEDQTFYTTPYDRETFALTPLKSGDFSLGKIKFLIAGTPSFYFQNYSIFAKESQVMVLPLPSENKPDYFQGGVGNFSLHIQAKEDKAYIGEPLFIKIVLEGEGSLNAIKDPLDSYCKKQAEDCINFNYNLYDINKQKTFKEITKGNFGFYSKFEYEYGISFKKVGVSSIFHFMISFFNPKSEIYETLEESLEEITILPPKKIQAKNTPDSSLKKSLYQKELIVKSISTLIFLVLCVLFAKKYLFSQSTNHQDLIDEFSDWVGKKRGILLKNFLISKKAADQDIQEILQLFKEEPNFPNQFENLNTQQKKTVLIILKKWKKEKIYDNTN